MRGLLFQLSVETLIHGCSFVCTLGYQLQSCVVESERVVIAITTLSFCTGNVVWGDASGVQRVLWALTEPVTVEQGCVECW